MKYQLECPVCEQRFKVGSDPSGKKTQCPGCSRKFRVSAGRAADTPPPAQPVAPPPLAKPLPAPLPLAKPIPSIEIADQPEPVEDTTGIETLKSSAVTIAKAKQKRRKQKMIRGLATIVGLSIIVAILFGFLVIRLQKQAKQDNTNAEAPSKNSDQDRTASAPGLLERATKTDLAPVAPKQDKKKTPKPEKKIRHQDLAPQKFVFNDSKQMRECWDQVQPHLVTLTVHDALGKHQAIGTIVDSRGWILTSYSAVKGASKIEVASGHKTIDQYYLPKNLTDSVQGVVVTDPAQDLAVLSVNRRFIVSFANIAITEKNFVVEGEYMLQCGSPTPKNVYASYESKILIAGKFDDLSKTSKAVASSKQLTSAKLPWLVCKDFQKALPGAPLVRVDGTLEAIHVFSNDDQAHYVPVHFLKPLLASANGEPQPLNVLRGTSDTGTDSSKIAVGVDHPARQSSVQLNRLANLCEQFDWIATDKSQYDQLQTFSQHFVTALKYIKENQESEPELAGELQVQLDQIKTSIAAGLNKPDPASVETMNNFAAADLNKPNKTVPFYGRVIELEITTGNDVLSLLKSKPRRNVSLNRDESRERFNRGDVCMAFVEIPAEKVRKAYKIGEDKVTAVVVDLITRVIVSK